MNNVFADALQAPAAPESAADAGHPQGQEARRRLRRADERASSASSRPRKTAACRSSSRKGSPLSFSPAESSRPPQPRIHAGEA